MDEFAKTAINMEVRSGFREVLEVLQTIAGANPQVAPALQNLQNLVGNEDQYEQEIQDFTFNVPLMSLQQHIEDLGPIHPQKDVHFRERNAVLFRNSNPDSYPHMDPETAAFQAREQLRQANPNAVDADLDAAEQTAREEQEQANLRASLQAPVWDLLQRDHDNDIRAEDALLVFVDTQHKNVDWYVLVRNLRAFGEPKGYTLDHYKRALDRFIGFFAPSLKPVTDELQAVELAQFLMRTSIPTSKFERLTSQMASLVRQPYAPLKAVLAQLQGAALAYYHDKPIDEQNASVNRLMIQGLVSFTSGIVNKQLLDQIRLSQVQGKSLNWQHLLEAVTNAERIHGVPQTPLPFQANLRSSVDLYHSTFAPVEPNIGYDPRPVEYSLNPHSDFYNAPSYAPQMPYVPHDYRPAIQRIRPVNVPVQQQPVHQPVHVPAVPQPGPPAPPPPPPPPHHAVPQLQQQLPQPAPQLPLQPPQLPRQPQPQQAPPLPQRHDLNTPPPPRPRRQTASPQRRSSRDRRQTMHYDAQAGAYLHNTYTEQRNRPYSPERSNGNRNNSRNRGSSQQNQYRQQSRDRYFGNGDRQQNESPRRDRQQNGSPRRDDNHRSYSRNNQQRNSSRDGRQNSRDRNNYNNNYNNGQRQRSPSPYRRDNNQYNSGNRPSRSDSRDRYQQRQRTNSRDRYFRQQGNSTQNQYPGFLPGVNTAPDYAPWANRSCMKCVTKDHHEHSCPKYYKYSPDECRKCRKGYHMEADCRARSQQRSNSGPRKNNQPFQ